MLHFNDQLCETTDCQICNRYWGNPERPKCPNAEKCDEMNPRPFYSGSKDTKGTTDTSWPLLKQSSKTNYSWSPNGSTYPGGSYNPDFDEAYSKSSTYHRSKYPAASHDSNHFKMTSRNNAAHSSVSHFPEGRDSHKETTNISPNSGHFSNYTSVSRGQNKLKPISSSNAQSISCQSCSDHDTKYLTSRDSTHLIPECPLCNTTLNCPSCSAGPSKSFSSGSTDESLIGPQSLPCLKNLASPYSTIYNIPSPFPTSSLGSCFSGSCHRKRPCSSWQNAPRTEQNKEPSHKHVGASDSTASKACKCRR